MSGAVVIIGAGGHGKVLIEALRCNSVEILGLLDTNPTLHGSHILGVSVIGNDAVLDDFSPSEILLINGVGSTQDTGRRREIFNNFKRRHFNFLTVIHPSATVSSDCVIGEGVQIMAGAVIQPGAHLGENSLVNTGVVVDHDCDIDAHVHIAPGAVVSGGSKIGMGCHVGCGSSIIQNIHLGDGAVIGAGAVVIHDVPPGITAVGVPARNNERMP